MRQRQVGEKNTGGQTGRQSNVGHGYSFRSAACAIRPDTAMCSSCSADAKSQAADPGSAGFGSTSERINAASRAQRSLSARLTPRPANAPAKLRRSQACTRGDSITALRNALASSAVDDEHHEGHGHEHRAQHQHLAQRRRRVGRHELRQEREEEDRQLGIQDVEQERLDHQAARRWPGARPTHRPRTPPCRAMSHNARYSRYSTPANLSTWNASALACSSAARPEHGGQQVRHDARGAAERRVHAGARAVQQGRWTR